MPLVRLYHGSPDIIKEPLYGYGKKYNDYGQGFYCTEHIELAKEWACTENTDGYANVYEIETNDLNILRLTDSQYSILHWMTLLIENRKFVLSTPIMERGYSRLTDNYHINLAGYDAVIGYRADDSYFSFARAFLSNEISLNQLSYAMRLGTIGEQFVLKSEKAFDSIKFIEAVKADNSTYYPKRKLRDDNARVAYKKELEKDDIDGIFIRDLIRGGISSGNLRI